MERNGDKYYLYLKVDKTLYQITKSAKWKQKLCHLSSSADIIRYINYTIRLYPHKTTFIISVWKTGDRLV